MSRNLRPTRSEAVQADQALLADNKRPIRLCGDCDGVLQERHEILRFNVTRKRWQCKECRGYEEEILNNIMEERKKELNKDSPTR